VQADVYVWSYALLVVHARKGGEEDMHMPMLTTINKSVQIVNEVLEFLLHCFRILRPSLE